MKKAKYFAVLLYAVLLTGCAGESTAPDNFGQRIASEENTFNNGEVYADSDGRLHFMDFETMNSSVLCSKPNCLHTNENDCSAFGMNNFPIIYKDKLYFFSTNIVVNDDAIREDTTIYQADFDGTNRVALHTIEGFNVETSYMLLVGGTIYMGLRKVGWDPENGVRNGRQVMWFASWNIDENKFAMIEKLCEGESTSIIIHGLWNGDIYFSQNKTDDPWDPEDPLGKKRRFEDCSRAYNVADGVLRDSDLPEPYCIAGGYYVYKNGGEAEILDMNRSERITSDYLLPEYIPKPVNQKIIDFHTNTWLDLETGEHGTLKTDKEFMEWYRPVGYIDGCYIFKRTAFNDTEYIKIPENDLF